MDLRKTQRGLKSIRELRLVDRVAVATLIQITLTVLTRIMVVWVSMVIGRRRVVEKSLFMPILSSLRDQAQNFKLMVCLIKIIIWSSLGLEALVVLSSSARQTIKRII